MAWRPLTVPAAPALTAVTLAEAKDQCRVAATDNGEDAILTRLIGAATSTVEAHCGTKLITQTLSMRCSAFCDLLKLPTGPIQSITSIKYLDTNNAEQDLSAAVYETVLDG